MTTATPRVSVVMAAYNAAAHVEDAVRSILAQTMGDFEFIIFEDGSTDDTREMLQAFDDPRIRLYLNDGNIGLTANLARGVGLAEGEFLARMDADDVSLPTRFEHQLAWMGDHPEIGILGSAVTFFDDAGWEFVATQPLEHDDIACELLLGYTLLHPTVMIRSEVLRRHHLNYDVGYRVSQDHELWTRLAKVTRTGNLQEPLVRMRDHSGKISCLQNDSQKAFSDKVRLRELSRLGIQLTERDAAIFNNACSFRPLPSWRSVASLDTVLQRILDANEIKGIYQPRSLRRCAARKLREVCRRELVAGNASGAYYWLSGLFWRMCHDQSLRETAGMAYRTIVLPLTRKAST